MSNSDVPNPNSKMRIEDVGEKLGGARKDMVVATSAVQGRPSTSDLLNQLWPKPEKWTDLIPQIGAKRAAFAMVLYENLAKNPHRDGWLRISGQLWDGAFRFGVGVLREVLTGPEVAPLTDLADVFNRRMQQFNKCVQQTELFKNQWSYAVGSAGTRTNKHPFTFSPIDDLRSKYLHLWGWGVDPRVGNRLAVGALKLTHRVTGATFWWAVNGEAGVWKYIGDETFETQELALEKARSFVLGLLEQANSTSPSGKGKPKWARPVAKGGELRSGFSRANSAGKTENDLLQTFGFRGVEFGNWVSQPERQKFVDAAFDAFEDLVHLLGMPPRFASLDGLLGLAYGSRGKGLSKAAAHFEPGNWVLHLTKENGPGAIAHEFGHALDCWIAAQLWGHMPAGCMPSFASEVNPWEFPGDIAYKPLVQALTEWNHKTHASSPLAWIRRSHAMDIGRKSYWSTPAEKFARVFEVLIHDSFALKGRFNTMLVYGVSQADGDLVAGKGNLFPYPLGQERIEICKSMALFLRAFKAEFSTANRWLH